MTIPKPKLLDKSDKEQSPKILDEYKEDGDTIILSYWVPIRGISTLVTSVIKSNKENKREDEVI